MNKIVVAALTAVLSSVCAFAQGLTLQSGTTDTLLSVPTSTGGFDFDSSGDIVYIGQSGTNSADTQVIKATAASGYNTQVPIVDYGTTTYGSFVTVNGTAVYYGDSQGGNPGGYINGSNLNITGAPPAPHQIAFMPDNYDMAFSGTTAVVSAYLSGTSNFVYTLNLRSGVYKPLLNTNGDYSGPVIFDPRGDLIYGESGYGNLGGIYIFSYNKVQNAIAAGTTLQLSDATTVISDPGNSAFALGPNEELFQAFTPFGGTATLSEYDLNNPDDTGTFIGTVSNPGDYFSGIQYYDGDLVVADTDGYSFTDFYAIVPEPNPAWLAVAGLAVAAVVARRRKSRLPT